MIFVSRHAPTCGGNCGNKCLQYWMSEAMTQKLAAQEQEQHQQQQLQQQYALAEAMRAQQQQTATPMPMRPPGGYTQCPHCGHAYFFQPPRRPTYHTPTMHPTMQASPVSHVDPTDYANWVAQQLASQFPVPTVSSTTAAGKNT
mmetsp:Transcript_517/g.1435  ORF Transcript_517/g.1435 Transcript_517/m.1435 type:complete len:144 (+) Transcript_517:194-625(+)